MTRQQFLIKSKYKGYWVFNYVWLFTRRYLVLYIPVGLPGLIITIALGTHWDLASFMALFNSGMFSAQVLDSSR